MHGVVPSALALSLLLGCTGASTDLRDCTADADCASYVDTPRCDRDSRRCMPPCTTDQPGRYACIDGDAVYCEDDMALPCTICPRVCAASQYCDAALQACAPRKEPGMPCAAPGECATGSCTDSGLCGVPQGEACTDETCDGVCARGRDGNTYCLRQCSASACSASTAGGYEWTCIRFGSAASAPSYCVPLENCFWLDPCATFENAVCGQACPSSGCYTFCVPDVIEMAW